MTNIWYGLRSCILNVSFAFVFCALWYYLLCTLDKLTLIVFNFFTTVEELSPGDPKQPVPGEGVPGQLELPGVCLRRHSGS